MSAPPRDILNPISENTGSPLDICGVQAGHGIFLKARKLPVVEWENVNGENSDGEGTTVMSSVPRNPTITTELRVVEPESPASTNMVQNPVAGKNVAGWTIELAGTTMDRVVTERFPNLETAFRVTTNSGSAASGMYTTPFMAVAGNTDQVVSGLFVARDANDVGKVVTISLLEYNAANALIATTVSQVVLGDEPKRGFATKKVSAACTSIRLALRQATPTSTDYLVSGLQAEAGSFPSDPFNGDTPGCAWTGTAHASTATRPVSGGPRFWAMVADLQKTVQRIKRRGGTYRHVPPNGTAVIYDLVDARITDLPEDRSAAQGRCEPTLEFECRPFGRLTPFSLPPVAGWNLLTIPIPDVPGSAPALGSLKLTELNMSDRYFGMWALRHRYLDNQPLEYTTASMTMIGATIIGGAAQATLLDDWMPLFELTGLHNGTYRVWGVGTMAAGSELAIEYGIDDARRMTRLPVVSGVAPRGSIIDFGQFIVPDGATGWKAQLVGRGAGLIAAVSRIWLQPVAECAGTAEADSTGSTKKVLRADGFPGSGELNGSNMAFSTAGARTWVATAARFARGSGKLSSLSAASGEVLAQASASGGTPENFSDVGVAVNVDSNSNPSSATYGAHMGVYARRAGAHHIYASAAAVDFGYLILLLYFTKGPFTSVSIPGAAGLFAQPGRVRVELLVNSAGIALAFLRDSATGAILGGTALSDPDLATGGTNATGSVGIRDQRTNAGTQDRNYRNFMLTEYLSSSTDVLVQKNGGARVTHEAFERLDTAGNRIGSYSTEGDFIRIPPSGREKSPSELSVLFSRSMPSSAVAHSTSDQVTTTLTITPRVLLTA